MQSSLFILGRQPALGLGELESLFGASSVQPIQHNAAVVSKSPSEINFNRIGGSIKMAVILTEIDSTAWQQIVDYIAKTIPEHLGYIPEGKLKLGFSTYGLNAGAEQINRGALQIKKTIKAAGRSVRIIPNKEAALNSAQVLYNQLTSPLGMELVLVRNGNTTILAQTTAEQDIDAYAARDQGRPKRDARVGMLPPKLAQIIVNLGVGRIKSHESRIMNVLDPFCGTGVILQEAILMGLTAYGSDLEPRMIEYTNVNLKWLEVKTQKHINGATEVGDATSLEWTKIPFQTIACETYLGRPFSSQPDPAVLQEVMQDVNLIHKRFLQNVAKQTKPGFRLSIAVPAWHTPSGFKHLKVLDNLEDLGYTRIEFVHARQEDLIYYREGQVVARELVVLVRS